MESPVLIDSRLNLVKSYAVAVRACKLRPMASSSHRRFGSNLSQFRTRGPKLEIRIVRPTSPTLERNRVSKTGARLALIHLFKAIFQYICFGFVSIVVF